jgi:hypothetical protein
MATLVMSSKAAVGREMMARITRAAVAENTYRARSTGYYHFLKYK